ncbi:Ig domain-containing protein [Leptospira sp. GIMC2001]|uniref:Ig domain-containing protein n=1 Tax=Leptospira sp. GIMC2001 TaxID=1513297 RepID=UPI002349A9DD|nr:Ig domain-containing protein [Leptospira sp. GIMC2001]WCL48788.1 Ig domain-containing protein [Leptospira sp. GIMC2001]
MGKLFIVLTLSSLISNCLFYHLEQDKIEEDGIGLIASLVGLIASSNSSNAAPSSLFYAGSPYSWTRDLEISTIAPTFNGSVSSCISSPILPTGILIDNLNCAISGTPTVSQSDSSYTITAANSNGSTTANINININVVLPPSSLSYVGSPYTFGVGQAITTLTPTFSGSITSCTSSPTLPSGLSIDNTTCAISGTPSGPQASTIHTITASNANGNTTTTIDIEALFL